MFKRFFASDPLAAPAKELYAAAVRQARLPSFYTDYAVPDSVDGRFELITLHVWLILRRLKQDGIEDMGQAVFDAMFEDMDHSLREMGAGDMGVGPRIKKMAQAFYGRATAYDAGLDGGEPLEAVVRRNLYGTLAEADSGAVDAMCDYIRRCARALENEPGDALARGRVTFADPAGHGGAGRGAESV